MISDAMTAAAKKANRDSDLVMAEDCGEIHIMDSMDLWNGTGRDAVDDVIRDCERKGDGFVAYYLVADDGTIARVK
jgi:hypothetical protein